MANERPRQERFDDNIIERGGCGAEVNNQRRESGRPRAIPGATSCSIECGARRLCGRLLTTGSLAMQSATTLHVAGRRRR